MLVSFENQSEKIQKGDFLENGKYPIVSQDSDSIINGYTNLENPILDLPVILFGDHNCHLKYIDFPFFRGADGTQILKFSNRLIAKFVFYIIKDIKLHNHNRYERHFKYLKNLLLPLPLLSTQKEIIKIIQKIEERIGSLKERAVGLAGEKEKILKRYLLG